MASEHSARKRAAEDFDLDVPIELIAVAVRQRTARCRLLGHEREITLRAGGLWRIVPGQVVTLRLHKHWRYGGHAYLSGEIERTRIDVAALGLEPLALEPFDDWDPDEEYWGEEDEPVEDWARPLRAGGPRPEFEMEQILPGLDSANPDSDPILRSVDLERSGRAQESRELLMDLLLADLRCLDAHAHLGADLFEADVHTAVQHYEVGFRIGELLLGHDFRGVLPWGLIDNRPFLRCMHGYALCLWRLGRHGEAEQLLERMLWLEPSDPRDCRFLLPPVRARASWDSDR